MKKQTLALSFRLSVVKNNLGASRNSIHPQNILAQSASDLESLISWELSYSIANVLFQV